MSSQPPNRRASKLKYREFRRAYKLGTLDQPDEDDAQAGEKPATSDTDKKLKRREHLRGYLRWLRPFGFSVAFVFGLAMVTAGLQMVEPLFMRFIIDGVLLNTTLNDAARLTRLNLGGAGFLTLIILSSVISVLKDYRQKLLNAKVMIS
ncbi:MAG: hypothetical protein ABIP90_07045, partial [Vicinamibacterales bacterium]